MIKLLICIPSKSFEKFKKDVLTTWYKGDPELVRHKNLASNDREYATFYSEYSMDIKTVLSQLPGNSVAILA